MTPSQASPSPLSPWSPGTNSIPTQTTTDNTSPTHEEREYQPASRRQEPVRRHPPQSSSTPHTCTTRDDACTS